MPSTNRILSRKIEYLKNKQTKGISKYCCYFPNYMYLALNNLQEFICHKNQPTNQPKKSLLLSPMVSALCLCLDLFSFFHSAPLSACPLSNCSFDGQTFTLVYITGWPEFLAEGHFLLVCGKNISAPTSALCMSTYIFGYMYVCIHEYICVSGFVIKNIRISKCKYIKKHADNAIPRASAKPS